MRLLSLHQRLSDRTWQPDPLRQFTIYEPKKRQIGAPSFSDRVVHHALHQVIEPIFDATFLPYSFACRSGKGTHAGVAWLQSQLRSGVYSHFLKTDFRSYFPSIDRSILHREIRRKISCPNTMWLIEQIIPTTGKGVPIGALTSQLSANIYGNMMDHYLHHVLRVRFCRYMDDIVVLGNDPHHLRWVKDQIEAYASTEMMLEISRWQIGPVSRGINFLGYRIWPTHKLLRKSSVTRAKRKIKRYTAERNADKLTSFVGAWKGHACHADTANLRRWLDREYAVAKRLAEHGAKRRPSRRELLADILVHKQ